MIRAEIIISSMIRIGRFWENRVNKAASFGINPINGGIAAIDKKISLIEIKKLV